MSSSPSPTTVLAEAQWSQQATASSPSRQRPSPLDNTNSQSASSGLHTAYSNITVQTTSATEEAAEFDPWIRKTLLTFDGGGVRGYSSLLILQALMVEIARLEQEEPIAPSSVSPLEPRVRPTVVRQSTRRASNVLREDIPALPAPRPRQASSNYLPSHYFDYIAGTSTGGLIAIMLGRLRMTVDECLEVYEHLANRVFAHPRKFHIRRPPWIPRDKYDHQPLEEVIKEVVKKYEPDGRANSTFTQANTDMCRTIVIAWQKLNVKGTRVPYLFRSYRHPKSTHGDPLERNPDKKDAYPIWQIGRATSAAPTYFKAVKIEEDDDFEFIDGGFGANNPSEEVYRSVQQICNNNPRAVKAFVSIGTGKNLEIEKPGKRYRLYYDYVNAAAKWASYSEKTHETVSHSTRGNAEYFRLNVVEGIGKMKLDAWKGKHGSKTLHQLTEATEAYLATEDAQALIAQSARLLVDIRRERANHPDRDHWERFCHGVEYACQVSGCTSDQRHFKRRALTRHLSDIHHLADHDTVERLLDQGKRFPLYEHQP